MLGDLTRICCDGSVEVLLCRLIRSQKLSAEDLIELKRLSEEKVFVTKPSKKEKKR